MTRHVLMSADSVGGVWTYALDLVAALGAHDIDVTLATMGAPLTPEQARAAAAIDNLEVFESGFALEWMPSAWRDVDAAGDWLLAIAALVRPDVIHINGYSHAALPFGVPVVAVAHSCVCSWHRAVRGNEAGPEWNEYRQRAARGLSAANAVIAPTRAILSEILDALRVQVPGRVISNGRSCAASPPTRKEPFVLAAGRLWDEAKGLATLDAAAARVSWPVRVAGPMHAPNETHCARAEHVELLGELPPREVHAWMSRASIYALPARYEPFGLSVLEAAQAGCALVLGDLATLREVWGCDAIYVTPGDVDMLADAITDLARDPLRLGVLGAAARSRARKMTPHRMAQSYAELYAEVAVPTRTEEVYS